MLEREEIQPKPLEAKPAEQLEPPENREQAAEKIIETAQAQRREILYRAVSSMVNFVPGVSAVKMTGEAFTGRTADGRKLTPWGRINHILVETINGSAWVVGFLGDPLIGLGIHAVGSSMSAAQYAPEIAKNLRAYFLRTGKTEMADKVERMKSIIEQGRWRHIYFESERNE